MKQIIAAWLNRYFANAEALVLLLLIVIVAAGLYLLGSIAVPILIALVFTYVLQGLVQRLAQLGQEPAPTTTNFAFDRGASDVPQEPMQRWLSRWLILLTSATNKRD